MHKTFFHALAVCLFFLSSCSNEPNSDMAYYTINGRVVCDSDSVMVPVANIQVIRQATDYLFAPDTIKTNQEGKFQFECTDYYSKNKTLTIKAEDIDKLLNGGLFQPQTIQVKFSSSDWGTNSNPSEFKGMAEKSIEIVLKK